jgi:hypothetical protein
MIENQVTTRGKIHMSDESEQVARNRARSDGLAAMGILVLTTVLIVFVITRLV